MARKTELRGLVGDTVLLASSGHLSISPDRCGEIVDVLGEHGLESYLVRWGGAAAPPQDERARRSSVDLLPIDGDRYVVLELNGAVDFDERYSLDGRDVYAEAARALGLPLNP